MDRRKGSCFAATGDLGTNSGWGNLRSTETAPVLGSTPRRSTLRKNRRLTSTEIVPPAVAASPGRGVASHRNTQGDVAPVTFFATGRNLSGRNGKRSASPDYRERRPQTQN